MARSLEAVSVDKLEGLLSCSICLETLKDPRTLPCFHSYCKSCLERFVKNHRDKAVAGRPMVEFNCPNCRSEFTLNPGDEVVDMTPNHFISNMLDVMAIQERVKGVPCTHCQRPSVGRCVTCEVFLCQKCLTDHNKYRGLQDHFVLSMDELSKPENQRNIRGKLYCKEHSKKALKFYCETCSELICRYCMDFNHLKANHSCQPAEKVADQQKKLLVSDSHSLAKELKQCKDALQEISDVTQSLEKVKEQVKRDINRRRDDLLNAVTQQLNTEVERLMGQVEEIYSTKHNNLAKQKEEVKGYVDKLESCVNISAEILEKGTDEEIVSSTKMIKENMKRVQTGIPENLKPVTDSKINYEYNTSPDGLAIPAIRKKMGQVKSNFCNKTELKNGNEQLMHNLSKNIKLFVYQGDITEEKSDAIVNPANEELRHCGGAAKAISERGGKTIQDESDDIMRKRRRKPLQPGDVEITTAGKLPCKFVVHALGPQWCYHSADGCRKLLQKAVVNSLMTASKYQARIIAIPAISSGVYGVPVKICAEVLFDTVEEFAKSTDSKILQEIRFVNIDKMTTQVFEGEMRKRYGDAVTLVRN